MVVPPGNDTPKIFFPAHNAINNGQCFVSQAVTPKTPLATFLIVSLLSLSQSNAVFTNSPTFLPISTTDGCTSLAKFLIAVVAPGIYWFKCFAILAANESPIPSICCCISVNVSACFCIMSFSDILSNFWSSSKIDSSSPFFVISCAFPLTSLIIKCPVLVSTYDLFKTASLFSFEILPNSVLYAPSLYLISACFLAIDIASSMLIPIA